MIQALKERYKKIWDATPDTFPILQDSYPTELQQSKEVRMDSYTDEAIILIKKFSDKNTANAAEWGSSLKKIINECGTGVLELGSMKLLLDMGFCEVTSDFMTRSREFDKDFKMDDIFQSLRNVWIANCIQLLMARKVELTPSVFAYSMLYPYTDNFLDASIVSDSSKEKLNARFRSRLAGEPVAAGSSLENSIFGLVGIIEDEFNRQLAPMVYESLLGIQMAQERSLWQSARKSGGSADVVDISIEKGGSSVLADGCLIKGRLTPEEASFVFGFGVMLQFIDDLQDASDDRNRGHMTIFSGKADRTSVEKCTNRLVNFTINVLGEDSCFTSPVAAETKKLIKASILFLLYGAVACNIGMYSRDYLKMLEEHSPLSFGYLRRFYKKIGREYGKLKLKMAVNHLEIPMAKAFASGSI
ncbi:MAG TPA: hypothetical protein VHT96_17615 [Clostridia bacterium]|nr:hypothetical protein [Clostridia bacterium]